jgi:tRNA-Thr(GGU) m(6)t(6)A37 methyltransferase TsaA
MVDSKPDFNLIQIGEVRSSVTDRRSMWPEGVPAEIEIFPEYTDGLLLIEESTHIWVVAWFEDADRERLQIIRPTYEPSRRRRGVFGLRSTTRPNSLAISPARLLEVRQNVLFLESLDFIDGTPVVDIKRYSPSYDTIFSARSSRDRYLLDKADPAHVRELEVEAVHFHGAITADIVAGARLIQYVSLNWNVMPKDQDLKMTIGSSPHLAILADAIQGLTAATFGSGRLRVVEGDSIRFEHGARRLIVQPKPWDSADLEVLRRRPFDELFALTDG